MTSPKRMLLTPQAADGVSSVEIIETQLAVLIRLLDNLSRSASTYRELDRASYLIARALETAGPVGIQKLAEMLRLEPTTVTRKIAAMESAGLIARLVDPTDKRVSLVKLSREGNRRMHIVRRLRIEHNVQLLDDWSESELSAFGELLSRYNDKLANQPDVS